MLPCRWRETNRRAGWPTIGSLSRTSQGPAGASPGRGGGGASLPGCTACPASGCRPRRACYARPTARLDAGRGAGAREGAGALHPGQDYGLGLGIVVQHLGTVLLAVAAVLDSAERQLVVGDLYRVYPGVAGVELLDGALRLGQVAGKNRGAQAVLGIVGTADRLVQVLHHRDRQQRAECFLRPDAGAFGDVGDDRRLEEPAVGEGRPFGTLAAGEQGGAAVERILELGLDSGPAALGVHRAHLRLRVQP